MGIPTCFVNIIRYWYSNQYVQVKYINVLSDEWKLGNGVRQGGVLSGLLFSAYIDSLLCRVTKLNIGCKLGLVMSNVIAYADDIVLLAPSLSALSILINEANLEVSNLSLAFNFFEDKNHEIPP